ncbi:hypothetical protein AeRB84_021747 [Aphanomyces euteiches]|nr:hypothetical protein AeRB84_021747 [Aphanomyces euteiches]
MSWLETQTGYAEHQKAWKLYDLESNRKAAARAHHYPRSNTKNWGRQDASGTHNVQAPPQIAVHQRQSDAPVTASTRTIQEKRPAQRYTWRTRERSKQPHDLALLRPPAARSRYTSGLDDRRQIGNDQTLDNLQHEITESIDARTVNTATEINHDSTTLAINCPEFVFSTVSPLDDVPQSHREAMASKDHVEWAKAEQLELHQLREAKIWKLVELPTGRKAIGSRWTYAKKINAEGEIVRYNAQFARGSAKSKVLITSKPTRP